VPTSRHPLQLNPTLIAARPNDPTLGAAVEVYRRLRSRGRYGYWSWSVVHVLSALRLAGHPVHTAGMRERCPDWFDHRSCVIESNGQPIALLRGEDYDKTTHSFLHGAADPRNAKHLSLFALVSKAAAALACVLISLLVLGPLISCAVGLWRNAGLSERATKLIKLYAPREPLLQPPAGKASAIADRVLSSRLSSASGKSALTMARGSLAAAPIPTLAPDPARAAVASETMHAILAALHSRHSADARAVDTAQLEAAVQAQRAAAAPALEGNDPQAGGQVVPPASGWTSPRRRSSNAKREIAGVCI